MIFKNVNSSYTVKNIVLQMRFFNCCLPLALCFFTFSCTQLETFEKNTNIPQYQWQSDFKAAGSFTITDTTTSYKIFIVLRHTDAYSYNNIWLNVGIAEPGDSMIYRKADIPLGTDASGWDGTGMNDIWEIRQLLMVKKFSKTGTYNFIISHIMRDDPLAAVMSAGLRLEKALP